MGWPRLKRTESPIIRFRIGRAVCPRHFYFIEAVPATDYSYTKRELVRYLYNGLQA